METAKIDFGENLYGMNLFMHFSDDNIDIFDNPYFMLKTYVMDDNKTYFVRPLKPEDKIELIKCPSDEIGKYVGEANTPYFKNTACFKDADRIELLSNWWRP